MSQNEVVSQYNFAVPMDHFEATKYLNAHSVHGMPGNWLPYEVAASLNCSMNPSYAHTPHYRLPRNAGSDKSGAIVSLTPFHFQDVHNLAEVFEQQDTTGEFVTDKPSLAEFEGKTSSRRSKPDSACGSKDENEKPAIAKPSRQARTCIFDGCNKSFRKPKDLWRHEQTHIGFRYECPGEDCKATSTRPDHLKDHIKKYEDCSRAALEALKAKGIELEKVEDISPKRHIREHFIVRLEVTLPVLS